MTRFMSRTTQAILDLAVLSLALWIAFFLRFDGPPPFLMFKRLVFVWPWVVGLQFGVMVLLGVHRFSWRFIGLRDVSRIIGALGIASAGLLIIRIASAQLSSISGYFQYALIPLGVIAMDFVIVVLGVIGVRALRRMSLERNATKESAKESGTLEPTILIGAGAAGHLVAKELAARPELGMRPICFLDDDVLKIGTVVHGIPVLGATDTMEVIAREHNATQALIAIASARGKDIRRLGRESRALGLKTKIIPTVRDIVRGDVNIGEIRELAIEDLLRREPIQLEEENISDFIADQVIVVTGAGGSIGSELCRQVCRFSPKRLIMIERAENALFEAHRTLIKEFPDTELVPCIADVGDAERIQRVFSEHSPKTVFHAAAHKHVPMMEYNPGEAIKNNAFGTKTLADAAHEANVEAFVMVSTDKAVNPTSVMGATKRMAEMYVQALANKSKTRFVTVRFGNVLGSAGSVIPIFKKQIAEGGPVTVTHPDMTRYFMTIPEACQLILQAGTMGEGSEIFILDMGEPVKIVDLARDLISLSGLEADRDIEIVFSGIRPGEKLFEELSFDSESADKTRHPKIFVGQRVRRSHAEMLDELALVAEALAGDEETLRLAIQQLVPEYGPTTPVSEPKSKDTTPATASSSRRSAEHAVIA